MIEQIINGINYRLNEETKTAEVIKTKNGYKGDIIIPETVEFNKVTYCITSIGEKAFMWCRYLKSITIPDCITSIGKQAFERCDSLTSIVIPNGVTNIGVNAFENCEALTDITIPKSVKTIGEAAFTGCSSLTSIVVSEGNTVYDSRENCNAIIETDTNTLICGCYNTTIPNSVESIGAEAFCRCESLIDITFQGTIAQWRKIELGNGWNDDVSATVVRCTDGNVNI